MEEQAEDIIRRSKDQDFSYTDAVSFDNLAKSLQGSHCEAGNDEAIPRNQLVTAGDCFAPLAMTTFCETISFVCLKQLNINQAFHLGSAF
jgi:hypothetical protein